VSKTAINQQIFKDIVAGVPNEINGRVFSPENTVKTKLE